ncbi:MAG: peptidylprolyl isomerase [Synechocystis sp.]|nr:peptidylprolyl isomerase [Synechocystis sp.]
MALQPLVTQAIRDYTIPDADLGTTINLFNHFDDPLTDGLIARFELYNPSLGGGITEVVLFNQGGVGAPLTVQNFVNYVQRGDYQNTVIHRSVPEFVIQGGGFTIEGIDSGIPLSDTVEVIASDPPVVNEFSPDRSNLPGTIAMAKLGGDPNSATNQWFFNLGDNSANLDSQNGGFTVFGEVLSPVDLQPLEAIAALSIFNVTTVFQQGAFTNFPLAIDPSNPVLSSDEDLVRYREISLVNRPELAFSVIANSNPNLVGTQINGGELVLTYSPTQTGSANLTVQATTLLGETIEDTFTVTVTDGNGVISPPTQPKDNLTDELIRFRNNDRPGTYLFAGLEEAASIRQNFTNFIEEGVAFQVATTQSDPLLQPFYRFQNTAPGREGTYLFAGAEEAASIRQNFTNFFEEGIAFYAYSGGIGGGTTEFSRLQNNAMPGTYLFAGPEESTAILNNPNLGFTYEGVAFAAGG